MAFAFIVRSLWRCVAVTLLCAAATGCDLNPQPLPPEGHLAASGAAGAGGTAGDLPSGSASGDLSSGTGSSSAGSASGSASPGSASGSAYGASGTAAVDDAGVALEPPADASPPDAMAAEPDGSGAASPPGVSMTDAAIDSDANDGASTRWDANADEDGPSKATLDAAPYGEAGESLDGEADAVPADAEGQETSAQHGHRPHPSDAAAADSAPREAGK